MDRKYFSVDISNDIHIVELHETLEQAKQKCLESAKEAYDFASDMGDFYNYEEYDLPYAVYGAVLGKAESNTRPFTEEELELGYDDDFDYIIEPPKLAEVNNWISVKDKLPEINDEGYSDDVLCYGKVEPHIEGYYCFIASRYYDKFLDINAERCFKVTHWQPLPQPPQD